jgi:Domain of unknown function (DUF4402)
LPAINASCVRTSHTLQMRAIGCALFAAALTCAGGAQAQVAQSGTGNAIVLNSGTLTEIDELDFGTLIAGAAATGTATINPVTNARSVTGGVTTAGGTPIRATFMAAGTPNRVVTFSLPNGSITITNGTGGTMTVNNFTRSGPTPIRLDANGFLIVRVGATLNVGISQPEGNYAGTYVVTVNFT